MVGGGLAGAFVAAALVGAGARVVQWHAPQPGAASPAAAGLYNVLTGAQPSLSWRAPELVAALHAAFAQGPLRPLAGLLHALPIVRPLHTPAQVNAAEALAFAQGPLRAWVAPPAPELPPHLATLRLEGAGWLDAPALLQQLPAVLAATGRYRLHLAAWAPPAPTAGPARPTVVATGVWLHTHPDYSARPLQPLKGQVLVLRPPRGAPPLPYALVGGLYVLPRPDGSLLLGSTHEPRPSHPHPTPEARAELLARLAEAWPAAQGATVIDHWAGLRPTTPDRRPLLGRAPDRPLWFVGGLGTKGVLQAPALAQWLVAAVAQHAQGLTGPPPWPDEVDWGRRALWPPAR